MIKATKSLAKILVVGGTAIAIAILMGFFIYAATILVWNKPAAHKVTADAIIVPTGARGRIEKGFELLLESAAPRLLISGVRENITFSDIVFSVDIPKAKKNDIHDHCCIDIDYIADTTETNAIESAKWIQKNNVQSIILVTSSSHMPRAYLQYRNALPNDVTITPFPVRTDARSNLVMSRDFWLYAGREYIKYLGSWLRLERK